MCVSCSILGLRPLHMAPFFIAKMKQCSWARSRARASRTPASRRLRRRPGKWRTRPPGPMSCGFCSVRRSSRHGDPAPTASARSSGVAAASPALSFLCQEPAGLRRTTAIRSAVGPEVAPAVSDGATWRAGIVRQPVCLDLVRVLRVGDVDAAARSVAARCPDPKRKLSRWPAPSSSTSSPTCCSSSTDAERPAP